MKDQDLKKWVARGQMSPSSDFTDQVMKALPVYASPWKKTLYRRIGLVSGLSLLMVILSLYADLPPIQVFSHSFVVPRLAIIAVAAIFGAVMVGKIIELKSLALQGETRSS